MNRDELLAHEDLAAKIDQMEYRLDELECA